MLNTSTVIRVRSFGMIWMWIRDPRSLRSWYIKGTDESNLRVHSFGMIWIRISDPRSLGSWLKGTDESVTRVDSSIPFMHHDPNDLGSLILIWNIPKERTLYKVIYFPFF